jgi:hypothetical protein
MEGRAEEGWIGSFRMSVEFKVGGWGEEWGMGVGGRWERRGGKGMGWREWRQFEVGRGRNRVWGGEV